MLAWQWHLYMLPFYSYILGIVVSSVFVRFPQKKSSACFQHSTWHVKPWSDQGQCSVLEVFSIVYYIEFWMDGLICIISLSIVFIHFNIKFYLTAFSALISLIHHIGSNQSLQSFFFFFFCNAVSILKLLDFSHIN